MIDPDGRDGIRVIDKENKTVTIKAVYFVQTADRAYFTTKGKTKYLSGYSSEQVTKIQDKINTYLNKQEMNITEGDYKGYSLKFDLQFREGGTVEQSKQSAQNETEGGHPIGNSFTKGNSNIYKPFESKEIEKDGMVYSQYVGGITQGNKDIMMNSASDTKMNRTHEIFHTLIKNFHPKGSGNKAGIGKYPPEKHNQSDINRAANSSLLPVVE
jgi:hypothetical protein